MQDHNYYNLGAHLQCRIPEERLVHDCLVCSSLTSSNTMPNISRRSSGMRHLQCRIPEERRDIFGIVFEEVSELQTRQSCTNRFVQESMSRYGSLCHFLPSCNYLQISYWEHQYCAVTIFPVFGSYSLSSS